jgi:hypothetical protein
LEGIFNAAELFISIIAEIELFSKPDLPPEEEASLKGFIKPFATNKLFQEPGWFSANPRLACKSCDFPPTNLRFPGGEIAVF